MLDLAADLERFLDPLAIAGDVGFEPDPWQADLIASTAPRILLNVCRQGGKSTTCSVLAVN